MAENLVTISYNLHGYNQGCPGIRKLILKLRPDIFMLQEHWLSPDNLSKLDNISDCYFVFGSSAMLDCVSSGPLVGRPFGGTAFLVNKKHVSATSNIESSDRFTVIKIYNWLPINVYLPCVGTPQHDELYSDILHRLQNIISANSDCSCLIGGDFNVDLDCNSNISLLVNEFMGNNNMHRCDVLFPVSNRNTFVNEVTNTGSAIDYMLSSTSDDMIAFNILELDVNLSDHLPIMAIDMSFLPLSTHGESYSTDDVTHLRWDHAPLHLYYEHTSLLLQPVLANIDALLESSFAEDDMLYVNGADQIYCNVVNILRESANLYIPKHKKNLYICSGGVRNWIY